MKTFDFINIIIWSVVAIATFVAGFYNNIHWFFCACSIGIAATAYKEYKDLQKEKALCETKTKDTDEMVRFVRTLQDVALQLILENKGRLLWIHPYYAQGGVSLHVSYSEGRDKGLDEDKFWSFFVYGFSSLKENEDKIQDIINFVNKRANDNLQSACGADGNPQRDAEVE